MTSSIDERILSLESRVIALESRLDARPAPLVEREIPSPREFLIEKSPRSALDKTLAAGYYLQILGGADGFDLDNIEDFYARAKEAAPANRRDPPYQNVKKGFFREIGIRQAGMRARNKWALTSLGIARVEGGFKRTKQS
jgi:hypothetical protein